VGGAKVQHLVTGIVCGGEFLRNGSNGERGFISPDPGELLDWILVLDDASKNYTPPGQEK